MQWQIFSPSHLLVNLQKCLARLVEAERRSGNARFPVIQTSGAESASAAEREQPTSNESSLRHIRQDHLSDEGPTVAFSSLDPHSLPI